jgi:hypothetical protein
MPRNTREALLRVADQALNDLDRCLENLKRLSDTYEPMHPKHAKFIELQAMQVIDVKEMLEAFKQKFM